MPYAEHTGYMVEFNFKIKILNINILQEKKKTS